MYCKQCKTDNAIIEQAPDSYKKQVRCIYCGLRVDLRDYNKKRGDTKPLAV